MFHWLDNLRTRIKKDLVQDSSITIPSSLVFLQEFDKQIRTRIAIEDSLTVLDTEDKPRIEALTEKFRDIAIECLTDALVASGYKKGKDTWKIKN